MCNELDMADRVLIICNEEYAIRADGRLGGVGWEARLVQGDLLVTQAANPRKYLPIFRGERRDDAAPRFLRGVFSLTLTNDFRDDHGRGLIQELYQAYEEAPPLGSPPRYVLQ